MIKRKGGQIKACISTEIQDKIHHTIFHEYKLQLPLLCNSVCIELSISVEKKERNNLELKVTKTDKILALIFGKCRNVYFLKFNFSVILSVHDDDK